MPTFGGIPVIAQSCSGPLNLQGPWKLEVTYISRLLCTYNVLLTEQISAMFPAIDCFRKTLKYQNCLPCACIEHN